MDIRLSEGVFDDGPVPQLITPEETFRALDRKHTLMMTGLPARNLTPREQKVFEITGKTMVSYTGNMDGLKRDLKGWKNEHYRIMILSGTGGHARRIAENLREYELPAVCKARDPEARGTEDVEVNPGQIIVTTGSIHKSFEYPQIRYAVLSEGDLFGREKKKKKRKSQYTGTNIKSYEELSAGDYVVHESHGLGQYKGLEKIEVDESVKDVGGLAGLRKWLEEKKELLTPEKRDELRAKGLQPPRGILLVGVPGCGKSLSAKSISASWRLPLYRLDFATVQGSYVGQTEQQLKNALTTAENVSPCILWIDEIEKGLSGAGSSGDGGVSTRMVGQFLFWLQECKKQVFVVATANDVSMLPSELLRRGRFDELFFVDLPTADERREILSLYMRKYLQVDFIGPFADKVVEMSDGFTGADLESTVRDLAYRSIANNYFVLNEENIITAFNNVVPLSQTSPEKIEAIRDWGKERAVPASGKPIGGEELSQKKTGPKTRKVLV
jgi:hypothetical protein